jgi:hypothetical protein
VLSKDPWGSQRTGLADPRQLLSDMGISRDYITCERECALGDSRLEPPPEKTGRSFRESRCVDRSGQLQLISIADPGSMGAAQLTLHVGTTSGGREDRSLHQFLLVGHALFVGDDDRLGHRLRICRRIAIDQACSVKRMTQKCQLVGTQYSMVRYSVCYEHARVLGKPSLGLISFTAETVGPAQGAHMNTSTIGFRSL